MSAADRQAISDAMNTVAGITCSPYYRQVTKAGEAMVRIDRTVYPDSLGGLATWQVVVILPQDVVAAEKYLDEKTDALVAAAWTQMAVGSVTPSEIVLAEGQRLPCVLIEGVRETN